MAFLCRWSLPSAGACATGARGDSQTPLSDTKMGKNEKDTHREEPPAPLDYAALHPMAEREKPREPSAFVRPLSGWALVLIVVLVLLIALYVYSTRSLLYLQEIE